MVDQLMSDWLRQTNQQKPMQTMTQGQQFNCNRLNPSQFFTRPPTFVAQVVGAVWVAISELTIQRLGFETQLGVIFYGKDFKSPKTRLILL